MDNQSWQRPKDAFCSNSYSKEVRTCSQTRLLKALPQFGLSRSWSTKPFSPSLVFSSFCHELLWSAWLCLLSSSSHWCEGCYWVPLFSCPSSQLSSPRNHSLPQEGKGPSPIASMLSAEFCPYGHYLPLHMDAKLDVSIWDLRSAEKGQTKLTPTELCHTSQGNDCQGPWPPHRTAPQPIL